MDKKAFAVSLIIAFVALIFTSVSFAAVKKAATAPAPAIQKVATAPAMPAAPKANFGMLAGTVSSVDNKDPANIKLLIKSDADGSVHTVFVTPGTNVTKVTDVSELKPGEPVRMMTRKIDDKDMAMGIMFGKVKNPVPPAAKAVMPPAAKSATKAKK